YIAFFGIVGLKFYKIAHQWCCLRISKLATCPCGINHLVFFLFYIIKTRQSLNNLARVCRRIWLNIIIFSLHAFEKYLLNQSIVYILNRYKNLCLHTYALFYPKFYIKNTPTIFIHWKGL